MGGKSSFGITFESEKSQIIEVFNKLEEEEGKCSESNFFKL